MFEILALNPLKCQWISAYLSNNTYSGVKNTNPIATATSGHRAGPNLTIHNNIVITKHIETHYAGLCNNIAHARIIMLVVYVLKSSDDIVREFYAS